ncbi:protein phosphatase, partial [Dipodascopsis tothii]|uniref:protein phosphatase n=1 Tax=Dipodascopsis tothii TaxID=44089 RepID=UPI0034CE1126
KQINEPPDVDRFRRSPAYAQIVEWVQGLANAVRADAAQELRPLAARPASLDGDDALSRRVAGICAALGALGEQTAAIAPSGGPRRFGDPAFRTWGAELVARAPALVDAIYVGEAGPPAEARAELAGYLAQSFGSFARLDYGTGHELSFLVFFGLATGSGGETWPAGAEVRYAWHTYTETVRGLVRRYSLEPAGSHGVWGLDDHFHLVYLFGAAEVAGWVASGRGPGVGAEVDAGGVPKPGAVLVPATADALAAQSLYFGAIAFVREVKRGPFYEHSPVLYDITAVPSWTKICTGLVRMYVAEVLGKFPVVQHLEFGTLLVY